MQSYAYGMNDTTSQGQGQGQGYTGRVPATAATIGQDSSGYTTSTTSEAYQGWYGKKAGGGGDSMQPDNYYAQASEQWAWNKGYGESEGQQATGAFQKQEDIGTRAWSQAYQQISGGTRTQSAATSQGQQAMGGLGVHGSAASQRQHAIGGSSVQGSTALTATSGQWASGGLNNMKGAVETSETSFRRQQGSQGNSGGWNQGSGSTSTSQGQQASVGVSGTSMQGSSTFQGQQSNVGTPRMKIQRPTAPSQGQQPIGGMAGPRWQNMSPKSTAFGQRSDSVRPHQSASQVSVSSAEYAKQALKQHLGQSDDFSFGYDRGAIDGSESQWQKPISKSPLKATGQMQVRSLSPAGRMSFMGAANARAPGANPRAYSVNPRAPGFNPRAPGSNPRAMSANPRVQSFNPRPSGANPRAPGTNVRAVALGGVGARPEPLPLMSQPIIKPKSLGSWADTRPGGTQTSSIQSYLQNLSQHSCDDLGIKKSGDPFRDSNDKSQTATDEIRVNEEVEDEDDDDDDDCSCCKICDMKFDKAQSYHVHIRSTSHHQKLQAKKALKNPKPNVATENPKPVPKSSIQKPVSSMNRPIGQNQSRSEAAEVWEESKDSNFCHVCNFGYSNAQMFNSHLQGQLHLKRLEEHQNAAATGTKDLDAYEEEEEEEEFSSNKNRDWESANERDLNPDDVGKPGSVQYSCEVCSITCTGLKSYDMHIVGTKHLKKLKKAKEIEEFEKKKKEGGGSDISMDALTAKIKRKRKVVRIQDDLDQCSEPLIGLDYMTEYQVEDASVEPRYICDLCQSKMDMRQVVMHVIGIRHRHKYFKYHSVREYNILWDIRKKSTKVKLATQFAAEVESREGRHKMRLKVQLKPFVETKEIKHEHEFQEENWEEIADAHTRPKTALLGLGTFESHSSSYTDAKDDEDDDEDDDVGGGPVDEISGRSDAHVWRSGMRGGPKGRGVPISRSSDASSVHPDLYARDAQRPPYSSPREQPRDRFPPPSRYPLPHARGRSYPSEPAVGRSAVGRLPPDPYRQHRPLYQPVESYSYDEPNPRALESRAVINYDHQSLNNEEEEPERRARDSHSRSQERRYVEESSSQRSFPVAAADGSSQSSSTDREFNIDHIKSAIANCNIDTEADAEIALQISNSLTQALLEYRLNALAKAGTSDPALEQHLNNLRQQNAELSTTGRHPNTSNAMYGALNATRSLALKLPHGDNETIKQAMSVLDSVNLQLYGMLDKAGDGGGSAVEEAPKTSRREVERSSAYREEEQEEEEPMRRNYGPTQPSGGHVRPPTKRFRFGL